MTIHLEMKPGEVAPTVLLPGDPYRARLIAERFFESPRLVNQVRGMLGFSGTYRGRPVTVQGTGMGIPSMAIYATELVRDYGARTLVRVGTCGAIQEGIELGDLVLAQGASTDSAFNRHVFGGRDFASLADFELLVRAWEAAGKGGFRAHVGGVFTTDLFYHEDPAYFQRWKDHGVLALEMETAALYTVAARYGARALSILSVSDQLIDNRSVPSTDRERAFMGMVEVALQAALQ